MEARLKARKESRRRNDHKRHSDILIHDDTAHPILRRTSKKAASRDRQGHVYFSEELPEAPITAPTPNSGHTVQSRPPAPVAAFSSSRSASPQLPVRESPHRSRTGTPQASHSRNGSKELQSRPRTRTLEERFRERSPTSLASSNRQRLGSLQLPQVQDVGSDSSIGFPSIIPSPPLEVQTRSHRQRPVKPLSRPLSPMRNPIAAKPGTPLSSSSTDAKKILQLMKTTCGRMHGILSFRTSATSSWASGYCAINVATGSLIYQTKGDVSLAKTLISDLRGCQVRTLYDAESRSTFLDVSTFGASMGVHLRPHVPETFDSWLAALLCWQPIRPKGAQNKMTKPQEARIAERKLGDRKRYSGVVQNKDASIIKVGKMLMWDRHARFGTVSPPPANRGLSAYRSLKSMSKNWRKVSCTLQENGHFKLYSDLESNLEAIIPLSALSRCAIQRLDPSILDDEFSLAIYPQYTSTATCLPTMSTVYLSMESRVLFEVWFVLLRAFTVPELYGPKSIPVRAQSRTLDPAVEATKAPTTDMFRVERHLSIRVIEAKLQLISGTSLQESNLQSGPRSTSKKDTFSGNYYAEVQLDAEIRGRTAVKPETSTPFWRQDFEFVDLPPVLSSAFVELKTRNPGQKDWTLANAPLDLERGEINPHSIDGEIEVSPLDLTYGKVELGLDDVERATDTEKWWPIFNEREEAVGEMFMKVRIDELVVLMGRDYAGISEILHTFSNGLTNQITQMAHGELKRLSEILLNIFQVSGHATSWLMSLVEDEIDSVHKETPMSKFRYGRRIASNDSFESGIEREVFLRNLGRNATVEANLLFRGNSLLTKALDLHMRRLGKEYLEDTLSEKLRDIDESDPECEVDPNRATDLEIRTRNWRNLIALTENVWRSIAASASRCPPELRIIMRRVRDCAEDRYGDFLRSVTYSSVSGFLFLRFFCPAVLNPKLFGLLKDHPRPRAQRTLTLIAKALQTLANMTTFGSKEPWMEGMNVFLNTHRQEFKAFVDEICDISSDRATSAIPPSYATPITILNRLPGTSREGFPSLPYLIDQARECASLVDVWLDARHDIDSGNEWSEELKDFDELCEECREKSKECLTRAEQAERPSGTLEPQWEELVEQMERKARVKEGNSSSSPNTPTAEGSALTENSSRSSLADGYFHRNAPPRRSPGASRLILASSPGSPLSPDEDDPASEGHASETTTTPPGSSSGVWDPGVSSTVDKLPPTPSEINEAELGIEGNSDLVGSSIYSLSPPKSKRDSAATAKELPFSTPLNPPSSHKKSPRSAYSLRHSSDRADISALVTTKPSSFDKPRSRDGPAPGDSRPPPRSLYRLNTSPAAGQPPAPGDPGAGATARSPTVRDGKGHLREGVFGGVFRKKRGENREGGGER